MKISELVLHLSGLLSQHGDVEVEIWDDIDGYAFTIQESKVNFAPGHDGDEPTVMIEFDDVQRV